MQNIKSIIALCWITSFWLLNFAVAQSEVNLSPRVAQHIEMFIDSSNSLSISEIVNQPFNELGKGSHVGVYSEFDTWYKVYLPKDKHQIEELALYFDQANIDSIEIFQELDNSRWNRIVAGSHYTFSHRKFATTNYILMIDKSSSNVVYVKVKAKFETSFNILVGSLKQVLNYDNRLNITFVLILGVILAMIGYNSFLYYSIREKVYLVYVIQSILTAILQVILFGLSLQLFWPNHVWIQGYAAVVFVAISTLSGLLFMVLFLKTKQHTPILNKIAWTLIGFYGLLGCFGWTNQLFSHKILIVAQPLIALFILMVAVVVIFKGYKPARYYLIAWSMFLVGILVYVLAEIGVIERNLITILAVPFGAAMEVVLLSLALANRINILKTEQEEAVSTSYRLEKEKATLIQEQNLVLEQKVSERTTQLNRINNELGEKNKEVEDAYSNLKETQSQLVNAEKMSSLGQLTAGIAHEINNPINFVSSNVAPLKRDVGDLLSLIESTDHILKEETSAEIYDKVQRLKEDIDFTYVLEEIEELLDGMKDGANRTVEIIKGLKLFSRVDEDDLKKVNLEEGIQATLVLLNSHLKHAIEVESNFANIPSIECYGGKMNQVFMNIFSNAIHAINSTGREDGKIIITTNTIDKDVVISIKDNGVGIPEEVKKKLYEPFFTTKPVGEGTGLGLSIVFTIIEKINGSIVVNSTVGEGTEFIITLPITNHQTTYNER